MFVLSEIKGIKDGGVYHVSPLDLRQSMRYKIQVSVIGCLAAFAVTACGNGDTKPAPQNIVVAETPAIKPVNVQKQSDVIKIVFLGDSLTAGYGLPSTQAWPEQVHKRLEEQGYKTQIINAGVSGDNTSNGLARYDWSVGSADANILVLALGGNDFLQGVSPKTTYQNLKSIIENAQADGLTVILAGVASPRLNERGKSYASVYPNLAREFDLSYFASMLEGVSGRPELLQKDGLHPNKAGVEVMASRFALHMSDVLDE